MTQEELNIFFDDAKFEEIVSYSETNETDSLDKRQIALAYFHTEHYAKSAELFDCICKNSNDAVDWFNLSSATILSGCTLQGLDTLKKAKRLNTETKTDGKGIPTPFMLLIAAQNLLHSLKYNQAFNLLNELASIYQEAGCTSDKVMYDKGIPKFDEFVKLTKKILPKQDVFATPNEWIENISNFLDEHAKEKLKELVH